MHKVSHFIEETLFALLDEKELEDISVSEVIDKSGVCRASFYRNFMSLEHVLKEYSIKLMDEIGDEMPISANNHYEHSVHNYEILLKNKKKLSILQKRNLLSILDEGYYSLCKKQIERLDAWIDEYQISFFAGSSAYISKAWIKNGFRETPEELAKIISKIYGKIGETLERK